MSNDPYNTPLPPRPESPPPTPPKRPRGPETPERAQPEIPDRTGATSPSLLVRFRVLLLLGGVIALALGIVGVILALGLLVYDFGGTSSQHVITATPDPSLIAPTSALAVMPTDAPAAITTTPNVLGIGTVTRDASGNYAFPVAVDPQQLVWTHYHWDGTNALDIEARFGLSFEDFTHVTIAPLVACAHGIVYEWSGQNGGRGYLLEGDDGNDYYYAHMSELWLPDGKRVVPGQPIGVIGNTGNTAQFIEPHLHFAIGPRGTLQTPAVLTVNAAEWLLRMFGLGWEERPVVEPPFAQPSGSPLPYTAITVITPYDQALARGLPEPAIELGYQGTPPDTTLDVVATLTGKVNVIRWTEQYGTRIQIHNESDASSVTVVISGVDEWLVRDGEIVTQGQVIGRWNPAQRPTLHYMLFRDSVNQDPTSTFSQQ